MFGATNSSVSLTCYAVEPPTLKGNASRTSSLTCVEPSYNASANKSRYGENASWGELPCLFAQIAHQPPALSRIEPQASAPAYNVQYNPKVICSGAYKHVYAGLWQRRPIVLKQYSNMGLLMQDNLCDFYQYYSRRLNPMIRPLALWRIPEPSGCEVLWSAHPLMYSDMFEAVRSAHHANAGIQAVEHQAMAHLMVQGVGEQLAALHGQDIAHGDVKLENMLLHPLAGEIPIVLDDFDFVKCRNDPNRKQGTLSLLAPELLVPDPLPDAATADCWALACSAFSVLNHRCYWQTQFEGSWAKTFQLLHAKHQNYKQAYARCPEMGPWDEQTQIPPAWRVWFAQAMHPETRHRWSIGDAIDSLPDVASGQIKSVQSYLRQLHELQDKWLVGISSGTTL